MLNRSFCHKQIVEVYYSTYITDMRTIKNVIFNERYNALLKLQKLPLMLWNFHELVGK